MSDEKIRLPDFLIADLYKSSLVDLSTISANPSSFAAESQVAIKEPEAALSEKIKFLGENGKRIIIIVNEPEAIFLIDNDLTFLTNILKACHLNLGDIAIINLFHENVTYQKIKEELSPQNLLFFDVEPSAIKLPFLIPAFQLQKFDDCTIMVAPPLSILNKPTQEGKLLKTKLWLTLKKIFNIE